MCELIPFGDTLLAAGVFPKHYDLRNLSFEAAKAGLQKEVEKGGYVAGAFINRLVGLRDARTPKELELLLSSTNDFVRKAAAFALGFAPSPQSANCLAAHLKEPPPRPKGYDARYHEAVEFYCVVSYTLALLRDARSADGLIHLLRQTRAFASLGGSPIHSALYEAYSGLRLTYLPRKDDDVHSVTLNAFIIEDLLVQLGLPAFESLKSALTYGGPRNYQLCPPLRRLGWKPTTGLEEFFYAMYDPNQIAMEMTDFAKQYRMPQLDRAARRSIVRSLRDNVNAYDEIIGNCIRPSIANGTLPIWEEAAFASEYDSATLRAFHAFLEHLPDRCEMCHDPLSSQIRSRLIGAAQGLHKYSAQ